jgi:protein O-GlcNAc transferase
MNILKAVPNSVLWLCPNSRLAAKNLQKEAVARGVAAERLIIAPFVDQNKHMGRLALADLALDTRVYNGHTTTSDAL